MQEPTEWLASLTPPILVVGNAVLSAPVPEQEYQSIVRINNYVLGGLSGSNVTHWVANGYPNIEDRPIPTVLIPWSLRAAKVRGTPLAPFLARMPGRVVVLREDKHLLPWFPLSVFRGRRFPSTGFCLLALLRVQGKAFDIAGFDGFKTGHQGHPEWQHGHPSSRFAEWRFIVNWHVRRR